VVDLTLPRTSLRNATQTSIGCDLHDQSEVIIMDFDLDSFISVENIINTIFNGVPLFPDPKGTEMLPPTRSQGSQDASVTLTPTPTLTSTATSCSTSIYSLGRIHRSESSPSSLSTQSGDDAHKQVRSEDVRPPQLDKAPSAFTDNSIQLLLAPGKLHLVLWPFNV
jgi:hypothetical protein